MITIKDTERNRIYTFTLCNKLIDISEKGMSVWNKENKTTPYIPNNVFLKLKKI